ALLVARCSSERAGHSGADGTGSTRASPRGRPHLVGADRCGVPHLLWATVRARRRNLRRHRKRRLRELWRRGQAVAGLRAGTVRERGPAIPNRTPPRSAPAVVETRT